MRGGRGRAAEESARQPNRQSALAKKNDKKKKKKQNKQQKKKHECRWNFAGDEPLGAGTLDDSLSPSRPIGLARPLTAAPKSLGRDVPPGCSTNGSVGLRSLGRSVRASRFDIELVDVNYTTTPATSKQAHPKNIPENKNAHDKTVRGWADFFVLFFYFLINNAGWG